MIAAVHDGADAAIPAIAVADTIKVVSDGIVVATPDRASLVAVQTPQAFRAACCAQPTNPVATPPTMQRWSSSSAAWSWSSTVR